MAEIETVVTFLDMKAEPLLQIAPPSRLKLMLMRAEKPTLPFFRYLYGAVGRGLHWQHYGSLDDAGLAAIIHDEQVEIWVAYVNGQPSGFFFETSTLDSPLALPLYQKLGFEAHERQVKTVEIMA